MKRVCYVHVGPHKTGTSSIQTFLRDNKEGLLRQGYFVPDSGARYGAHHWLVRKLCGEELQPRQQRSVANSIRALAENFSPAVVISSEALDGLLTYPDYARSFLNGLIALDLEPRLVLFPRHQPQWLNSRYSQQVKAFQKDEPFRRFIKHCISRPGRTYMHWVQLVDAYGIKLISSPFTSDTIVKGVTAQFLRAIGIESLERQEVETRHNEAVGPFTVSVARRLLREIGGVDRLKRLQAVRLKAMLARYLAEKGLEDRGYVGLNSSLAEEIERSCIQDNDRFARLMWGTSWSEVYAADIGRNYTPNDYALAGASVEVRRQVRHAVSAMSDEVFSILQKQELAIDAPWNDIRPTLI